METDIIGQRESSTPHRRLRRVGPDGRRQLLFAAQQRVADARAALAVAEKDEGVLRTILVKEGFGAEVRAFDTPPPVQERKPIAMTRVKSTTSFVTEYERIDYALAPGQIGDVPTAIVGTLIKNGWVEKVPADTPTTRPQLAYWR